MKTDDNPFFSAKNPCQVGHNCSQVCYTDSNNTATCACFANYKLQSDGKTCLGALIYCWFMHAFATDHKSCIQNYPLFKWFPVIKRNSTRHTCGSQLYFLGGTGAERSIAESRPSLLSNDSRNKLKYTRWVARYL